MIGASGMVSQLGIATRSHAQRERLALPWFLFVTADVLVAFLAFGIATALVFAAVAWTSESGMLPQRINIILTERLAHFSVFVPVLVFWFTQLGHYRRGVPFWTEVQQVCWVIVVVALADGFSQYVSHQLYSRSWLVLSWVLVAFLLVTGRRALKSALLRAGVWQLPTVVVGSGETIDEAVAALGSERHLGYEVVARIDLGAQTPVPAAADLLSTRDPRFVVIAAEATDVPRVQSLIADLHRKGAAFAVVPPLSGMSVLNMSAQGFFSHDAVLLTAPNNLQRLHARILKRCFDLAVSAILLVALSPLFGVLALMIRRDGGPALFGQRRVGRGGRRITCLKFRTMVADADRRLADLLARDPAAREEWARDQKLRNDPRVTPVGRFLRRTSLDELPQLINVLRGEMSLVGPRPIVPDEVPRFGEDIVYYYEVDPGITGLWQVSGRNGLDYARRVQLNSWYVRNWSLWHDVTILFRTVRVVLERDGAY